MTAELKVFTSTNTVGWSPQKKAVATLGLAGLARTGRESAANLLAADHWLFLMFDEIAIKPYTVDTIFVCGGVGKRGVINSVATYSISTNEWRDAPNLPEPRSDHGIAFAAGRVFVFGGFMPGRYTDTCTAFSISKNMWEVIPSMTNGRFNPGVAVVGDRIFVVGGWDIQGHHTDSVEVYKVSGNTWTAPGVVAPMPTPRVGFGVAVIGTRIFAIGGLNCCARSTVEVHDTETNMWTKLSPMPTARHGMAVAVIGHQIWCFGGWDGSGMTLDVVEVFDADKNEWNTSKFRMPSPMFRAEAMVIDSMIWIIGNGYQGDICTVQTFDPETGIWASSTKVPYAARERAMVAF
ncbi:MAG: kelch repeat-containing protein [Candidatus Omnitrophota bacterium]